MRWSVPFAGGGVISEVVGGGRVGWGPKQFGIVFLGVAGDAVVAGSGGQVLAYGVSDGRHLWTSKSIVPAGLEATGVSAVGPYAMVGVGKPRTFTALSYVLADPSSGAVVSRLPRGDKAIWSDGASVVLVTANGVQRRDVHSGAVMWSVPGTVAWGGVVLGGVVYLSIQVRRDVYRSVALRLATGDTVNTPVTAAVANPVQAAGSVLIGTDPAAMIDTAHLAHRWVGPAYTDTIAVDTSTRTMYAANSSTGDGQPLRAVSLRTGKRVGVSTVIAPNPLKTWLTTVQSGVATVTRLTGVNGDTAHLTGYHADSGKPVWQTGSLPDWDEDDAAVGPGYVVSLTCPAHPRLSGALPHATCPDPRLTLVNVAPGARHTSSG